MEWARVELVSLEDFSDARVASLKCCRTVFLSEMTNDISQGKMAIVDGFFMCWNKSFEIFRSSRFCPLFFNDLREFTISIETEKYRSAQHNPNEKRSSKGI